MTSDPSVLYNPLHNQEKYADLDDQRLVELFQEKDEDAFKALYQRYWRKVRNFMSRHFWWDEQELDDLTQDVFVSLYRNLGNFRFQSKVTTYIFGAALNHARTWIRNAKRAQQTVSLDKEFQTEEGGVSLSDFIYDSRQDVEEHFLRGELKALLNEAVYTLPEENREVFILREYQNLGFDEIVRITGHSMRKLHYLKEAADISLRDYFRARNIDLT